MVVKGTQLKEQTTYPNAPIVEAILDIRVKLPEIVTLESLEAFHDSIKERFPKKRKRFSIDTNVNISSKGPTVLPSSGTPIGHMFSSADNKIVQPQLRGFSFNKLKSYEDWDTFRTEGRELWDLYSQIAKPIRIERISLRYINRIEVPMPIKKFRDYILLSPQIPETLPQAINHFFIQLTIPHPENDLRSVAKITMSMETPTNEILPLIFDVDVISFIDFTDDEKKMWESFEKLRHFKNEVFNNSITDKTRGLFT